jgi:hypothetical protein
LDDDLDTLTEEDLSLDGEEYEIFSPLIAMDTDDVLADNDADLNPLTEIEVSDLLQVDEIPADKDDQIPRDIKDELKDVLSYMDHLLESLPEEKIEEFANSQYFDTYKKLFKELGLV